MRDIQGMGDDRGVDVQRVGVKGVVMPLSVMVKEGGFQRVRGEISLCVDLPRHFKGTHMSRFLEVLEVWGGRLVSSREVETLLRETCGRLDAGRAEMTLLFTYFIPKRSPVSALEGLSPYPCLFHGVLDGAGFRFFLGVEVPVMTLCPCSREIARCGAHTQRATVRAQVRYHRDAFVWIEDLVASLETLASSPLYPVVSGEDEKHITERSYDTPRFVEDVLRDAVLMLRADARIRWFEVECDSEESIHNHYAFALQREEKAHADE